MAGLLRNAFRARLPRLTFGITRHSNGFASQTIPKSSRLRKYSKRTAYLAAGLSVAYIADNTWYASTITRNLRTFWTVSNTPRSDSAWVAVGLWLHCDDEGVRACERQSKTSLPALSHQIYLNCVSDMGAGPKCCVYTNKPSRDYLISSWSFDVFNTPLTFLSLSAL